MCQILCFWASVRTGFGLKTSYRSWIRDIDKKRAARRRLSVPSLSIEGETAPTARVWLRFLLSEKDCELGRYTFSVGVEADLHAWEAIDQVLVLNQPCYHLCRSAGRFALAGLATGVDVILEAFDQAPPQ